MDDIVSLLEEHARVSLERMRSNIERARIEAPSFVPFLERALDRRSAEFREAIAAARSAKGS